MCADGNPCTINTCDPSVGCVYEVVVDCAGWECDTWYDCNSTVCGWATCVDHRCEYVSSDCVCEDYDECTIDACDPVLGCSYTAIENCTRSCYSDSECFDSNPCTVDTCDVGTMKCVYTAVAGECDPAVVQCTSSSECDDGIDCTYEWYASCASLPVCRCAVCLDCCRVCSVSP
jgi:slime mold repeat-containing protein